MIAKMQPLKPRSRYHAWKDTDAQEIKTYIAVEIGMGLLHHSNIPKYFSKGFFLTQTPGFGTVFSRNRYEQISACLHFVDNEDKDSQDRIYKIRPIIDMVKDLYPSIYVSNRELSVDETMLKFKGRLFWKQYMPKKPSAKWGIKVWSLCDAKTSYLLKCNVYTGKMRDLDKSVGVGATVVQLASDDKSGCLSRTPHLPFKVDSKKSHLYGSSSIKY